MKEDKVVQLYGIWVDDFNIPLMQSTKAIEKSKTYLVKSRPAWLDYKHRVSKKHDSHLVHFSAQEAINAFRKQKINEIRRLQLQITQAKNEIFAVGELEDELHATGELEE